MRKLTTILALITAVFTFAGTKYYVSTTGSDSNTGLTLIKPFKTITKAADIASHGDTIFVLAGTYKNTSYGTWDLFKVEQTVKINNKTSTSGKYLVIKPYQNDTVKIKGDGDFIFQIRNSSYIRVEGFEIEGEVDNIPLDSALKYQFYYHDNDLNEYAYRVPSGTLPSVIETMTFPVLSNVSRPTTINNIGLLVQGSNHIDIVKNNIHHNTGTGLRFYQCDYINCLENNIHNNSRRSSVGNHGLVFHSSTSIDNVDDYKIFIGRNHVHDNYNEVYSWSELKTFITPHIDEGKGISMQKNTVGNGWKHGKMKIENNIADHNGFSGIHVNEGIRIDIVNNTAYDNWISYDGSGNNFGISVQGGDQIGVYNNISVAPVAGYAMSAADATNFVVKNNLVSGNIDTDVDAVDVNTIFADPMFVDNIQFKLQATSQAINTSFNSIAPTVDYYSVTRDANPDRGAVEYVPTIPTSDPFYRKQAIMYPNPVKNILTIENEDANNIFVYTIDGKKISDGIKTVQQNQITNLNFTSVPNGIYLVKIGGDLYKIMKNQ